MPSTTDLHDIFFLLPAGVSIGVASSEDASPMLTRLHQKLALALVSHKCPSTKVPA